MALSRLSAARLQGLLISACSLTRAHLHSCSIAAQQLKYNQPKSANDVPRFGGIASMFRLPIQEGQPEGLDACFVGIPMDNGCSYRSGTRQGPRQIRHESAMLRPYNLTTGAAPFESLQVADIGDVPTNPYDLKKTMDIITEYYRRIMKAGCVPLGLGGDHSLTLPILRAVSEKHGPLAMIQVDAHADVNDTMFGEKLTHGTPFRRAAEEGIIDVTNVVQIGLRSSGYTKGDYDWSREQGIRMVFAHDVWNMSLEPLMESIRKQIGDKPVYFTFDIDGIDPSYCPGTGTPEIAGLTSMQALQIVRGCKGLNIVGCDLVEVNPLYDPFGTTALVAANILHEMLCVLPGVKYY